MAWHDASCAKLDLVWEEERPGCRTCDRRAPELTPAHPIPPPSPPPDTRRSSLVCTWPPCVTYTRKDEDKELLAFVRTNIDCWTGEDILDGKPNTSSASIQPISGQHKSSSAIGDVYEELPEAGMIRLLRIHGSEGPRDPMHCALEIHRLHDPCLPVFEALSYTWADSNGDSTLCKAIYLGPYYHVLPITSNCLAALRRFRTGINRLVWVDAICINQFDLQERGFQVSMMRDIYSIASRVLVYAGHGDPRLDAVMKSLALYDHHKPPARRTHPEVEALLHMRYFSRIWTIQEVQLARSASLTIGRHTVNWQTFAYCVKLALPQRIDGFRGHWVQESSNSSKNTNILSCMKNAMRCQSGDPRDRVYGLMGLVEEDEQNDLPIDYDISVQQLFTGLAAYWLSSKQYNFLDYVTLPRVTPGLPSWVPDWTALSTSTSDSPGNQVGLHIYVPRPPLSISKLKRISKSVHLQWKIDTSNDNWYDYRQLPENMYWERQSKREDSYTLPSSHRDHSFDMKTGMGILALSAIPILVFYKGVTSFPGPDNFSLGISVINESSLRHELDTSGLYLYRLADCRKAFFMRKHAGSVFSIFGPSLSISVLPNKDESTQPFYTRRYSLYRKIVLLQSNAVETWLENLFFYGLRTRPEPALIGHAFAGEWLSLFPLSLAASQSFDATYGGNDRKFRDICTENQSKALDEMRSSVLRRFPRSIDKPGNLGQSHFDDYLVIHGELFTRKNSVDSRFAEWLQNNIPNPTGHIHADLNQTISHCQTQIERLNSASEAYGSLESTMMELQETNNLPEVDFIMYNSSRASLYTPLLVHGPSQLDWKDNQSRSVNIKVVKLLQQAHQILDQLPFDENRSVEWNLDRLLIHVLTLEMVVSLQELMHHRRLARRLEGRPQSVESIYLI